ncbi:pilus assembly protein TadG-related protein [Thalassoroseus pseudoceratinae]|uniref:pilus assembly protein TadG-related protein n=1 Tax=Thalassoroseus pseudoceratinae TaxID=2713176 RepID=UPI001423517E|nr:pilus assembly protein TadG-related protein [Thalassoroseus pseudoceratinae]
MISLRSNPKTQRPARRTHHRSGLLTPAVGIVLLILMIVFALLIDSIWLDNAQLELQQSTDAAALAAAAELAHDDLLRDDPNWVTRLEAARQSAAEIARLNLVGGRSLRLDTSEDGDLWFGRLVTNDEGRTTFISTDTAPRTVVVNGRQSLKKGNPIGLLLQDAVGNATGELKIRSEASIDNFVIGVRPLPATTVPGLPLAINLNAEYDDRLSWESAIDLGLGEDNWSYDPVTRSVSNTPDGIKEIIIRSKANDEDATEANLQLVDLNTELSDLPLYHQIQDGWTAKALEQFGGQLVLADDTIEAVSSAVINDDVQESLDLVKGEARIVLLYDQITPSGSNGFGTVRIAGFAAGRIVAIIRKPDDSCEITFQPAVIATRTAVRADGVYSVGELTDAERAALENPYIYKISLTH